MIALSHPRTWPLWDVFFPPLCAVCGRPLVVRAVLFCDQCWADAPVADLSDLRKLHHVDVLQAGFRFGGEDVVRAAVHALKYEGARPLARVMASHLLRRVSARFLDARIAWTPVPLHWARHMARGFNQSRALADELTRQASRSLPVPLLRRTRHTPSQTARTYRERAANVKDAFALRRNVTLPEQVVLVDDVVTTGATVDECASTLKQAGVVWVGVLAFSLAHHVGQ